ncbi:MULTISPECIES: glycerate kinase [Microbacterium]|uniref:glycerate kinase n=1 Tax=Microbacterium TaxID=33882 RepID=UPI00278611C6|nr:MULTISPECIES: glycerate kinase [Microbacterium]MDQ1082416.1 glycerate kinase [Microbacterium sp. SORGH_AS_0344]MDQ1168813.1 glycerate kinase [Microbacterium proteolyticum]
MHIVIAPDKFKGTLTAVEAADAMAAAVRERWAAAVITVIPMADGGDGTLDAFGGANRRTTVTGPLGLSVDAGWRLDGDTAVIESAAASGLVLAGGAAANDPWNATSRGVGELIALALDAGATRVLVGMGGSAMTDGGRGAIEALGDRVPFPAGRVVVLTDTTVTFAGAARVFAPQKGADGPMVARLTARLETDAADWARCFGVDVRGVPRTGAAGGLSGALAAAGAELVDGAAFVAETLGLDAAIAAADLVLTGEGEFDATTLAGKGPGHVLALAAARSVPALVVAGVVAAPAGTATAFSLTETVGREQAWSDPIDAVRRTTATALTHLDL